MKIFHSHDVVNVEAIIIKSLFVIHDFGAVDVVLKCKYLHIFAMIIYVVNVVAVVSNMELKFVFFGNGSQRSEFSGEIKLHIFKTSSWRSERSSSGDLISFFRSTMT